MDKKEVVYCETLEEWQTVNSKLPDNIKLNDSYFIDYGFIYKDLWHGIRGSRMGSWYKQNNYTIYTFNEWLTNRNLEHKNRKGMKEEILDVLTKTYNNPILRETTVPTFFSNPGTGKSSIIKEFAKEKGVRMLKITLSQRMPNEIVGGQMPNIETKTWQVFDSEELNSLQDGDILFFDEIFNGVLKQSLDALLNLLEDRTLPSGKKLAKVLIITAANPQGLINLTPQIKERFIRYDLKFNAAEYQSYLKQKYGMPEAISKHLCTLINKEKFESNDWNYTTPRSVEKSLNQIGCDLKSPYDDTLLPFLKQEIDSPMDISLLNIKKGEKVEYLSILKLLIKEANKTKNNDTKNNVKKSRATDNISC